MPLLDHVNSNPPPTGPGGGPPDLDTGSGFVVAVGAPVALTVALVYILGWHFVNTAALDNVLTITDTAGNVIEAVELPPGAVHPLPMINWRPALGLKLGSSVAGMKGQLWAKFA